MPRTDALAVLDNFLRSLIELREAVAKAEDTIAKARTAEQRLVDLNGQIAEAERRASDALVRADEVEKAAERRVCDAMAHCADEEAKAFRRIEAARYRAEQAEKRAEQAEPRIVFAPLSEWSRGKRVSAIGVLEYDGRKYRAAYCSAAGQFCFDDNV